MEFRWTGNDNKELKGIQNGTQLGIRIRNQLDRSGAVEAEIKHHSCRNIHATRERHDGDIGGYELLVQNQVEDSRLVQRYGIDLCEVKQHPVVCVPHGRRYIGCRQVQSLSLWPGISALHH